MESVSFRIFLKGYYQNFEIKSIQQETASAVEGKNSWDLTNNLETN